ncbi:MAG TPA: nucleotidyltransferase domain-containing protein [Bryobacteraceae bacterium]
MFPIGRRSHSRAPPDFAGFDPNTRSIRISGKISCRYAARSGARRPVLRQFLQKIADVRGRIGQIVLFGSRARGDNKPWSDYDVLLIVDRRDQALKDRIYDSVVEIQADMGCDLSLKIVSEIEWNKRRAQGSRFASNVAREGIILG